MRSTSLFFFFLSQQARSGLEKALPCCSGLFSHKEFDRRGGLVPGLFLLIFHQMSAVAENDGALTQIL